MNEPIRASHGTEERPDVVTGYMCGVDFECELGAATDGNKVHPSVDDLKRNRQCWEQCGIVEVEVKAIRWVETERFDGES